MGYTYSLCGAARLASCGRAPGSTSHWHSFPGSGGTLHHWAPSEAEGYSEQSQLGSHVREGKKKIQHKGSEAAEKGLKFVWTHPRGLSVRRPEENVDNEEH